MADVNASAADGGPTPPAPETNPLLPDLQAWKEKARAAEAALAEKAAAEEEARRQAALTEAKTVEQLEAAKRAAAEELAQERRALTLQRDAALQGINENFLKDDGTSSPESVIAAAKASQDAYNAKVLEGARTTPITGGATPPASGKRIYTQAEIAEPSFYAENRDDILSAQREGRIKG